MQIDFGWAATVIDGRVYMDPYKSQTKALTKTTLTINPHVKTVAIRQACDTGSYSMEEYHGKSKSAPIDAYAITKDKIIDYLLSDKAKTLLKTIDDGFECNWDGNNMRGTWSDEALAAFYLMADDLGYLDEGLMPVYADDWLMEVTAEEIEDGSLDSFIEDLVTSARMDGFFIVGDIDVVLKSKKENE